LTSAEDEPATADDQYEANDCPHQLAGHEAPRQDVYALKEKRSANQYQKYSSNDPDDSHIKAR